MSTSVLVVDADHELATLVRQVLEETGSYSVTLSATSDEAIAAARAREFHLAIIDLGLPDFEPSDLLRQLRTLQPGMAMLALSSSTSLLGAETLGVHAVLAKPFYLPDLVAQVRRMAGTPAVSAASAVTERPGGGTGPLSEAALAAKMVERGARDSGAYLVLLTRDDRRYVHAGPMPQTHVELVVAKIRQCGVHAGSAGALLRYLRVPGSTDPMLLYCFPVSHQFLLAVVYPGNVPFGTVRRQVQRLVDFFTAPDHPAPTPPPPERRKVPPTRAAVSIRLPRDWLPQGTGRITFPFLEPRLAAREKASAASAAGIALPGGRLAEGRLSPAVQAALQLGVSPVRRPTVEGEPETAESWPRFTILFAARSPANVLQGPLASSLVAWTKEACAAWEYHPLDILIRPDTLCLTVELPAAASPPAVAHRLRQELSQKIAENYPAHTASAASGRFWCSRYLLVAGDPPNAQRVSDFVQESRGASGPLG